MLFLLVPDQVAPALFNEKIAPTLKKGCTIVVASGYNVFYKKLKVAPEMNVVMVAPRMVGASVRSRYESGEGFPFFVSAEQVTRAPSRFETSWLKRGSIVDMILIRVGWYGKSLGCDPSIVQGYRSFESWSH